MSPTSKLLSAFVILAFTTASGAPPQAGALQVSEGKTEFVLVMPGNGLTMNIPKGGLSETKNVGGGSAREPGYFAFQDQKNGVLVSGWFEPQDRFWSAKKVWETDTEK